MPNISQNSDATLLVIFMDADGALVTGVTPGSLTCTFTKNGGAPTLKTLNSGNFTELGTGQYTILFTGSDLDTVGPFGFVVAGASIANYTEYLTVIATSATIPFILPTCDLTDVLNDLSGSPIPNASVSARILSTLIEGNVGVGSSVQAAKTDSNGVFTLSIIRQALVEVQIPLINYRRTLTVPNSPTANLFSIP